MGEHPNFIRDFVTLREGTEVPETFALWTGITGVSTALGRRVWLDMVKYKLYPNFFIVLTAGSGKCRKSTTIGWLEDIFDLLDPRPTLIAQKITPEALWGALKNEQGNGEVIVKGKDSSEATVVADELTVFLNRRSYEQGLGDLLIQLFDCKRRPEYETRARGKETINNSFLTVLGGATMKGIRDTMPIEDDLRLCRQTTPSCLTFYRNRQPRLNVRTNGQDLGTHPYHRGTGHTGQTRLGLLR